jgi:hypothetical protein
MATSTEELAQTHSDGPSAAVQRYVDAFNVGDADGLASCFTDSGFILDGMAPHVWAGPTATRDWHRDALAESAHLGVTDFEMALGKPLHNAVVGDAAYFVAPATLSFNVRGQSVTHSAGSDVHRRAAQDRRRVAYLCLGVDQRWRWWRGRCEARKLVISAIGRKLPSGTPLPRQPLDPGRENGPTGRSVSSRPELSRARSLPRAGDRELRRRRLTGLLTSPAVSDISPGPASASLPRSKLPLSRPRWKSCSPICGVALPSFARSCPSRTTRA